MNKTYSAKPSDVTRRWILIDASEAPLGRIATVIATYLTGKNKPIYTAHIDCGDNVVVINAEKLVVTGNKLEDKMYYRHSGYPSGLKEATLKQKLEKDPRKVIELAVKGMLPKNKLSPDRLARLRVFNGAEHEHTAQQPQKVEVKRG
ncbi:50S ribosomal protein L13 [Candidatus Saccharibacteria bacterium]|jgi:large subunit ribosomal protein L13|nr:50S ribosomal protein L13 [Candidatus Saccharibacteria bacterium]